MKNIVLSLVLILVFFSASGQNSLKAVVKDSQTNEVLVGVAVQLKGTVNGISTDENGVAILTNIPDGPQTFVIRMPGYQEKEITWTFPKSDTIEMILLVPEDKLEEIVIEGTRSNRSIDNIPTRVEVLTEEIDEASTMDPSKIAHLLTHSTGIQVQQTSATSNTANVRIQGLDGRYTQILKDGFPLYGGFSGSLSIMQIPPLDLRQVEYVKGSASTLYGAGAISGLINLLSKEPKNESETILHLNASHIGAFDVNAFTSQRKGKFGYTLLAQRNSHAWFDADNDGFSDMPELTKYNFNPKFFVYFSDKTKMYLGATITSETRQGGDIHLFETETTDSVHFYKEINRIKRYTTQFKFDHQLSEFSSLTIRNSFNVFNRYLQINPSYALGIYQFAGDQLSSFSEIAYLHRKNQQSFITGFNFYSDDFIESKIQSPFLRNESLLTIGHFVNYTFDVGKLISIESGLRTDYTLTDAQLHVLPRASVLFKWTPKLTTRMGGGLGYRNATIFNQEAELLGYRNILPIDRNITTAENSYGANADIGFKTPIGEKFFIHINQMFFYNRLDKPLVLVPGEVFSGTYEFINANGYTQSYGAETFFKFGFYDFVLFVGYTYTHVTNHFSDTVNYMTLTPQHSLKGDLLYALPGKWRIGADYEYKSSQLLNNGKNSPAFWTFGLVIEYTWKYFSFFGNVENYTNVRQTNYESLVSGPFSTPQFTDVWAPLDGIVMNAGLKIRF